MRSEALVGGAPRLLSGGGVDEALANEQRAEVLKWVEDGAHIYVCGDEKGMGRDVDAMLGRILADAAQGDDEAGRIKLKELTKAGRYQRDLY